MAEYIALFLIAVGFFSGLLSLEKKGIRKLIYLFPVVLVGVWLLGSRYWNWGIGPLSLLWASGGIFLLLLSLVVIEQYPPLGKSFFALGGLALTLWAVAVHEAPQAIRAPHSLVLLSLGIALLLGSAGFHWTMAQSIEEIEEEQIWRYYRTLRYFSLGGFIAVSLASLLGYRGKLFSGWELYFLGLLSLTAGINNLLAPFNFSFANKENLKLEVSVHSAKWNALNALFAVFCLFYLTVRYL